MDIVYIRDLKVDTVIGIFDWERAIRQTVSLDLEMATDIRAAAASDHIDDIHHMSGLLPASLCNLLHVLVTLVPWIGSLRYPLLKIVIGINRSVTDYIRFYNVYIDFGWLDGKTFGKSVSQI